MINKKGLLLLLLFIVMLMPELSASEIANRTVEWLRGYGLSPLMIVLLISMLPIIELRGAIPVGILLFRLPWPEVVLVSIIGNMIPIPLILLFMEEFFILLSRWRAGKRFTDWLFARTRRKGKVVERYEAIGLTIFVGIPLPGTGGWTGAFAANIFGIKFWNSMLYVFLGVLIAAVIVTSLTLTGQMVAG